MRWAAPYGLAEADNGDVVALGDTRGVRLVCGAGCIPEPADVERCRDYVRAAALAEGKSGGGNGEPGRAAAGGGGDQEPGGSDGGDSGAVVRMDGADGVGPDGGGIGDVESADPVVGVKIERKRKRR